MWRWLQLKAVPRIAKALGLMTADGAGDSG